MCLILKYRCLTPSCSSDVLVKSETCEYCSHPPAWCPVLRVQKAISYDDRSHGQCMKCEIWSKCGMRLDLGDRGRSWISRQYDLGPWIFQNPGDGRTSRTQYAGRSAYAAHNDITAIPQQAAQDIQSVEVPETAILVQLLGPGVPYQRPAGFHFAPNDHHTESQQYAEIVDMFRNHRGVLDYETEYRFSSRMADIIMEQLGLEMDYSLRNLLFQVYVAFIMDDENWDFVRREVRAEMEKDVAAGRDTIRYIKELRDLIKARVNLVDENGSFLIPFHWRNLLTTDSYSVRDDIPRLRKQFALDWAPYDRCPLPYEQWEEFVARQNTIRDGTNNSYEQLRADFNHGLLRFANYW